MNPRETLAAYGERINAHDFDLLLDLLSPDVTFWFSDGTHRGLDAARVAFERTWAAFGNDEQYWLDQLEPISGVGTMREETFTRAVACAS